KSPFATRSQVWGKIEAVHPKIVIFHEVHATILGVELQPAGYTPLGSRSSNCCQFENTTPSTVMQLEEIHGFAIGNQMTVASDGTRRDRPPPSGRLSTRCR